MESMADAQGEVERQAKAPADSSPDAAFLPLDSARWQLAMVWVPSCAVLFLILVAQSLGGAYGTQLQRAWGWALPTFLPTLALMTSVFAADALSVRTKSPAYVRRSFFGLAMGLSLFYLFTVFVSVGAQPFVGMVTAAPDMVVARLELLELSNMWLSPLQSMVVAALGVLFFLKEQKDKK